MFLQQIQVAVQAKGGDGSGKVMNGSIHSHLAFGQVAEVIKGGNAGKVSQSAAAAQVQDMLVVYHEDIIPISGVQPFVQDFKIFRAFDAVIGDRNMRIYIHKTVKCIFNCHYIKCFIFITEKSQRDHRSIIGSGTVKNNIFPLVCSASAHCANCQDRG